jgi:LacI family transcriptional regulator
MSTPAKMRKIALLFNANHGHVRDILGGVASYLHHSQVSWELYVEHDYRSRLDGMAGWDGDGIIADFDDPAVAAALRGCRARVVAVGGSYRNPSDYPAGIPYVATDNAALVTLAYEHLVEAGLRQFALYSLPPSPQRRWAREREHAFQALAKRDGFKAVIEHGHDGSLGQWEQELAQLGDWLRGLPKPVGVIAVNDARARLLLQACASAGLRVPEQVALVGIDNDALAGLLARLPLSSVIQGAQEMGRTAAQVMHRMLQGAQLGGTQIVVAPEGVNAGASCRPHSSLHPHVVRALYYIRQFACRGIKSEQVADYVGISRSWLEIHFRRDVGRTVHDEILRVKLDAATKLLAQPSCNIADIAGRCGFSSVQYLYTVFARELGCTPRAYHERITACVENQ